MFINSFFREENVKKNMNNSTLKCNWNQINLLIFEGKKEALESEKKTCTITLTLKLRIPLSLALSQTLNHCRRRSCSYSLSNLRIVIVVARVRALSCLCSQALIKFLFWSLFASLNISHFNDKLTFGVVVLLAL